MNRLLPVILLLSTLTALPACSTSGSSPSHFSYPSAMALGYQPGSDIRTLYVANTFTGTISEINTSSNTIMPVTTTTGTNDAVQLNMYPEAIEYGNGYLYVAGFTQSTALLESLSLATNQTADTVYLKGYPLKTLFISQTSQLYVLESLGNAAYLESFTVGSTVTPDTFAALTFTPSFMALTPDDSELLLSAQGQSFISVLDPGTLAETGRIVTDYPVTLMSSLEQYDKTMLYAAVMTATGYNIESINAGTGKIGYEFTIPGIPGDLAVSSERMLLDDNHFSYLGIIANANGYLNFINIDNGCQIPSLPSGHTGVTLTSTVSPADAPSVQTITTNDCTTQTEQWILTYNAVTKNYDVTGTVSGLQSRPAVNGTFFASDTDSISLYLKPGSTELNNGDRFIFDTTAASGTKLLAGFGLPRQVIVDPSTNLAYVSDMLTNTIYVVSLPQQGIIATIK